MSWGEAWGLDLWRHCYIRSWESRRSLQSRLSGHTISKRQKRAWTKNDREERIPSWKNTPRMKGPCVAEVMVRTEKLLFDP